jgi:phospholipase/lecithinase/hemolysin
MLGIAATGSLTLVQPAQARLTSLDYLYVFGDSLSDGGNSGLLTDGAFPPSPYSGGRASNGPVAVEYLWNRFNPVDASFMPSLKGGTNFAVTGATSGVANINALSTNTTLNTIFSQKGIAWQLDAFEARNVNLQTHADTSLFVVWYFGNDLFYYSQASGRLPGAVTFASSGFEGVASPATPAGPEQLIRNGITNIVTTVAGLAQLGARHFLVPNLPDAGKTPFAMPGSDFSKLLSQLTATFNTGLEDSLNSLQAAQPGIEIIQFQADDLFDDLLENPAAYGFTNTTDRCMAASLEVTPECEANQASYLFWDGTHPTTATHRIIGHSFYGAVVAPVPGPLPAFGAIAAFGWSRCLRRRISFRAHLPGSG